MHALRGVNRALNIAHLAPAVLASQIIAVATKALWSFHDELHRPSEATGSKLSDAVLSLTAELCHSLLGLAKWCLAKVANSACKERSPIFYALILGSAIATNTLELLSSGGSGDTSKEASNEAATKTDVVPSEVVVIESPHEYENNMDILQTIEIPGAVCYKVTFDERSITEESNDYCRFYKAGSQSEVWGDSYSGSLFPGKNDTPPLIINAPKFTFHFHSDGSVTKWGYRITVSAVSEQEMFETPLIIESRHNYRDDQDEYKEISISGASAYSITFDNRSRTERGYDYVRFYKDSSHTSYFGMEKYTGGASGSSRNFPGCDSIPPLVIPSSKFIFHFHSDGGMYVCVCLSVCVCVCVCVCV